MTLWNVYLIIKKLSLQYKNNIINYIYKLNIKYN